METVCPTPTIWRPLFTSSKSISAKLLSSSSEASPEPHGPVAAHNGPGAEIDSARCFGASRHPVATGFFFFSKTSRTFPGTNMSVPR